MLNDLLKKEKQLAVISLGYVGLPLVPAFARQFPVIGFDTNANRVAMLHRQDDPSKQIQPHFVVVAVPAVDACKVPDLKPGGDFKLGYSPEWINSGDKRRTLTECLWSDHPGRYIRSAVHSGSRSRSDNV